jgi:outer membrane protein assembly factor BamB
MRYLATAVLALALAHAQDFSTSGNDAHRSGWVRTDPKINTASIQKPGFDFLWKVKVPSNSLSEAALLNLYIGYRGFRALGFVGGGADKVFAFDTDLGRVEWQKSLGSSPGSCGMTANVARAEITAFPAMGRGGRGGGRGNYARSAVGEPDEGAVTVKEATTRNAAMAAAMAAAASRPQPPAPGRGAFLPSVYAPHREYVYAISSDGMLHSLNVSNGEEFDPAIQFLPADANAMGLAVTDNVAYVTTSAGCGNGPNAVWALDLGSGEVVSWKGAIVGSEGAAFGPDGTVYVATDAGELVALEAKTLEVKDVYKASAGFASSPVVFQSKGGAMVAVAAKDGRIHVVDAANLGEAIAISEPVGVTSLGSWQDAAGIRYLLGATPSAVVALKIDGSALTTAWAHSMASPLKPLVVNGVAFAASSTPAVLYALDGATGASLWESGNTLTGVVKGGGISAGGSQVYLGTQDGTFYAFGFPIEH